VRAVVGDRTTPDGLAALGDGTWDAVVDTWSAAPRVVRDAAAALRGRAGHYTYVSSRSVYAAGGERPLTEDAPVVDGSADAGDVDYTASKRGGELAAPRAMAAGLRLRPPAETVADTWAWLQGLPPQRADRPAVGLSPETECKLLAD
jgi:hypothetical protein